MATQTVGTSSKGCTPIIWELFNTKHFSVVIVSTLCISTATFVTFLQNLLGDSSFFLIHTLFIICDYFCKWGFCCEIDKGPLQQVCHWGLAQSHGLPSAQRRGLHEGMLHLETMHEKKVTRKTMSS